MDERTFSLVAMGMQEFLFQIDSSIRQLNDSAITSESVRQVLFLDVVRKLEAKIDISRRAYQNYTQFKDALNSGQPIFNYSFRREPRVNSVHIVPVPLFHQVINMSKTIKRRSEFLGKNINSIINRLNDLKNLANTSYHTGYVDDSELFHIGIQYLYVCREYLQSRDQFLYDVPTKILAILDERSARLDELWLRFQLKRDAILTQVTSFCYSKLDLNMFAVIVQFYLGDSTQLQCYFVVFLFVFFSFFMVVATLLV